ncbi:predicted protein [Naegleria gruberi]|uniref:Predicted protein n=1 Tax=Naegleria gruberi TaxID=5762 RepID=D2VYQ4_NAEGR|nr:uncharacterized protein NAEGRDRAFT_53311 [Naegleria gruberi]EFC37951.1 predicted protein [Naegleria gruberi]|eukprot:XP_002670695.1 predicted protein [Naegleria gruberi strain NEG-M]
MASNNSGVCNGRGHCIDYNHCSCNYGYSGIGCELYSCYGISANSSRVCSGRGTCSLSDSCICQNHYTFQQDCSVTTCNGEFSNSSNVCSSHGQCISYNHCNCSENYYGNNCEMFKCFNIPANDSSVCFGKGNCSDYNTCNCELNYYGLDCSEKICNGTLSSNSSVCSSRGSCVAFDLCNCTENYFGDWCELTTCFNTSSEDASVCSGKGVCVNFDTCTCQSDAYGSNCSEYGCFGVMNSEPNVCSSRGACLNTDRCNCSDNYFGNYCQLTTCFGITSNESIVCSGMGDCIDFDMCQCQTGFYGDVCESHSCFGILYNNETVCSSNGNCTQLNHCECNSNFTGIQCETLIVIPDPVVNITMNETIVTNTMNETSTLNITLPLNETIESNVTIILNETLNATLNETVVDNSTFLNETLESNNTSLIENTTRLNETVNATLTTNETINANVTISNQTLIANETILDNVTITNNITTVISENVTLIDNTTGLNETVNATLTTNETIIDNVTISNETLIVNKTIIDNVTITDNITIITNETNIENSQTVVNETSVSTPNITLTNDTIVNNETTIANETYLNETMIDVIPIIENDTILCEKKLNCSNHGDCLYTGKCRCYTDDSNGYWSGESCDTCLFGFYGDSCRFRPPVAIIAATEEVYSSCDDILIDGRSSYSFDGTDLNFYWKLIDSDTLQEVSSNHSNVALLRLKGNIPHGNYFISLQVESTTLNQNSSLVYSNIFKKSKVPIPVVNLIDNTIEKFTNQFPLTAKKTLTESACAYEKSIIEWSQISGPPINYQVDQYFNLYIPSMLNYGKNSFTFQVTAYYPSSPKFNATQTLIIKTKSTDLSLDLIQTTATETSTNLVVKFVDLELNGDEETWKWSCLDNNNTKLMLFLSDISQRKVDDITFDSSIFGSEIPNSIELTLQVSKSYNRSIEKSTIIYFNAIPPIVSIVYTEPSTSFVLPGQQLFLQTFIANNQQSNLTVFLNGQVIGVYDKTGLIIDTSNLEQGSQNTITIQSYDPATGKIFTTTYTFNVASNPKPCKCSITPSIGTALETDFDFYCANCKTDIIDYQYGFVDDKSGVKISLRKEEVYSSKLPAPYYGSTVTCYFDIIDTSTNAYSTVYVNVTVEAPTVSTIDQLQNLVEIWESRSNQYILDGEFSKGIYQSATTSRTDSVLMRSAISSAISTRASNIVCGNGVEISGICKCFDGYVGQYCERSIKSFSNIQSTKIQVLRHLSLIGNNTYEESMNSDYLSLLTFAVDSILINYPFLKSETIHESLTTFNNFLVKGLINSNLRLSSGADLLLSSCLDSAYKYIIDKQYLTDQTTNSNKLLRSVKLSSYLQVRSVPAGRGRKTMTGPFFSIVLGKSFFHDYETKVQDPHSMVSVEMENGFFDNSAKYSLNILLKQFMYVLTVTDDIYSLNKKLVETETVDSNTKKRSNLISKIVSIEYLDSPSAMNEENLIYSIPVEYATNNDSTPLGFLEERTISFSYSCGDFLDGNSNMQSNCEIVSIQEKSIKCRCKRFTNVFVIQTATITTQSYGQYVAIGGATFVILLLISIITLITLICVRRRKRKQQARRMVMMEASKIQDIILENREAYSGLDNYDYPETHSSGNRSDDDPFMIYKPMMNANGRNTHYALRTHSSDIDLLQINKIKRHQVAPEDYFQAALDKAHEMNETSSSRSGSNDSPRRLLGDSTSDVYAGRVRSGSAISVGIIWDLKEPILPEGGHSSDNESSQGSAEQCNTPKKFDDHMI